MTDSRRAPDNNPKPPPIDEELLRIEFKGFYDLSLDELYELMVLRNLVFVVGQKITAEPEVDGRDPECLHVLLRAGDQLIGTTRIFLDDEPQLVGRVAIHPRWQRGGYGSFMMRQIQERLGNNPAEMHAQAYLEDWYSSLGWETFGEPFDEAGIPHVHMRWGKPIDP